MHEQLKCNTISWQAQWDNREPRTTQEEQQDKIRTLRWELDIDSEINYSVEELEEMAREADERDDGE